MKKGGIIARLDVTLNVVSSIKTVNQDAKGLDAYKLRSHSEPQDMRSHFSGPNTPRGKFTVVMSTSCGSCLV